MSHLPEAAPTRSWYRIQAKSNADQPKSIEVLIYDEIGLWGISAARFIDELKAMDDGQTAITIAINSPGGDVFDGFAIHNALLRLGARPSAPCRSGEYHHNQPPPLRRLA